jgi:hypothetical protein
VVAVVAWVGAGTAVTITGQVNGLGGLLLVGLSLIMALGLLAHREHQRIVRAVRTSTTRSRREGVDERGEIIDRLRLSALSLGRMSEDLAASNEKLTEVVARHTEYLGRQVEALQNLYAVLPVARRVPPMSTWPAPPDTVLYVVERLVSDRPSLVVECGSGGSTLWLALAVSNFALEARIVALESTPERADQTNELLAAHGVQELVDVRHAAIEPMEVDGGVVHWYSRPAWSDLDRIGLVVVGTCRVAGEGEVLGAVTLLGERVLRDGLVVIDERIGASAHEDVDRWLAVTPAFRQEPRPFESGPRVLHRRHETLLGRSRPEVGEEIPGAGTPQHERGQQNG